MPFPPQTIANAFLEIAKSKDKALTNMQLQKLVYFAHAWHLAVKEQPLINTPVKAWNFGPVIPPLYNSLKTYGNGIVQKLIAGYDQNTGERTDYPVLEIDKGARAIIDRVWEIYGNLTGGQMSTLTHKPGEPWDKVYKSAPFSEIPDAEIMDFYKKQLKKR